MIMRVQQRGTVGVEVSTMEKGLEMKSTNKMVEYPKVNIGVLCN
jgi:hypothetical protein